MYCSSQEEISQAARNSTSGELGYHYVQNETYELLGLIIIEELVSFKKVL